jgi:hypothetical protein
VLASSVQMGLLARRAIAASARPYPPRSWPALRRALLDHCAHESDDAPARHLLTALRRFPRPRVLEWHDPDNTSTRPWVHFGDPDPDWPEYDWYAEYTVDEPRGRLRIEKLTSQFTP